MLEFENTMFIFALNQIETIDILQNDNIYQIFSIHSTLKKKKLTDCCTGYKAKTLSPMKDKGEDFEL